jgi:hypothetical protein
MTISCTEVIVMGGAWRSILVDQGQACWYLKGCVSDLLFGDLFKDDVDQLWAPMNEVRKEQGRPDHVAAI